MLQNANSESSASAIVDESNVFLIGFFMLYLSDADQQFCHDFKIQRQMQLIVEVQIVYL
jgi:hypothetical protein